MHSLHIEAISIQFFNESGTVPSNFDSIWAYIILAKMADGVLSIPAPEVRKRPQSTSVLPREAIKE